MAQFFFDEINEKDEPRLALIHALENFLEYYSAELFDPLSRRMLIPNERQNDLRMAWAEISNPDYKRNPFRELRSAISIIHDDKIHEHGLWGNQLQHKIRNNKILGTTFCQSRKKRGEKKVPFPLWRWCCVSSPY